jgi:hypothetical protein
MNTDVIPEGMYCYTGVNGKIKVCPYWGLRGEETQNNGYCSFLGRGDSDVDFGLLWDQVKECGINKGSEC